MNLPLILSVFPILLLIFLMVKRNAMASYHALPLIAVLVFLIQWFYFGIPFGLLAANSVAGLIDTLTPITVIFGAIFFNRMMEETGCTDNIRRWLSNINPNPVAQLMIVGWAFAFMIEGASGFGTPAAIAAPILVGLGFKPMQVAVFALVMNSVPVSFGAVGTPTWFGFGQLLKDGAISNEQILQVGQKTALIHFIAGLIIPVLALRFITTWKEIFRNIGFVYISILGCTVPYVALAQFNYEFPSLVAGGIGLGVSVWAANHGIGLSKDHGDKGEKLPTNVVLKALMPLGMLMVILIITRVQQLGLKGLLNREDAWIDALFQMRSAGGLVPVLDFQISDALIVSFKNIFNQGVNASYKTLYVPAFIPFVVTVWFALIFFRTSLRRSFTVYTDTVMQTLKPCLALVGALIMVRIMGAGGEQSMIKVIGSEFARIAKGNWIYFSSFLGAIGAFFSGSNTLSNLTFGGIQHQIATVTQLNPTTVLATQSVGGAMGNMVCINNIVAVCSVLNVQNQEGNIIKRTIVPMVLYGLITAGVVYLLLNQGQP